MVDIVADGCLGLPLPAQPAKAGVLTKALENDSTRVWEAAPGGLAEDAKEPRDLPVVPVPER